MDFKGELRQLGDRVATLKGQILMEEAIKNALVLLLIPCSGYEVFGSPEAVPEFDSQPLPYFHCTSASTEKKKSIILFSLKGGKKNATKRHDHLEALIKNQSFIKQQSRFLSGTTV